MTRMGAVPERAPDTLSERDRRILDFEREWSRHVGAKEAAIRERFSLTPARYYQLLNGLIDDVDAVRYDPMLVGRLRRLRDARTAARGTRVFGADGGAGRPFDER
ncbi:uncharacterized protein DUF3263 [Diaminobutyricimonas aerilata]|uniref:Uncharacterized protein DUF3263 n=2 Tax=Diaminobutyricimonas aerilata TaxID=1162967 RepID=A0A2M9CM99_9MICO|nr:uncharacterized protein DUF3263 [Diaminobutyricimonas aerilata]